MLDDDSASWSEVHALGAEIICKEGIEVSNAKAVLLSSCSLRNLADVEIVLPKTLLADKEMLEFASEMKKDLMSDRLTWRVERSEFAAKAESKWDPKDRWELKPSLLHQNLEYSICCQILLDFDPGDKAATLRAARFKDMDNGTYTYVDTWTRAMLQSEDPETRHGIWGRVCKDEVYSLMANREMAARIWFGLQRPWYHSGDAPELDTEAPPLDLELPWWKSCLQDAIDQMREERLERFGSEAILDEEDIRDEILKDAGDTWDTAYDPVDWYEDWLLGI